MYCIKCGCEIIKNIRKHMCSKCYHREYYLKNKDKILTRYQNNREQLLEYQKQYNQNHPEDLKRNHRNYYYTHKEKYNTQCLQYQNDRYKNDTMYKITKITRNAIRDAIKRRKNIKNEQTIKILGCSILDFKLYIEQQFLEGMSWDNYGEWELDHIKPISLATNLDELLILNHYTNFQPLWAHDNRVKSNKF